MNSFLKLNIAIMIAVTMFLLPTSKIDSGDYAETKTKVENTITIEEEALEEEVVEKDVKSGIVINVSYDSSSKAKKLIDITDSDSFYISVVNLIKEHASSTNIYTIEKNGKDYIIKPFIDDEIIYYYITDGKYEEYTVAGLDFVRVDVKYDKSNANDTTKIMYSLISRFESSIEEHEYSEKIKINL